MTKQTTTKKKTARHGEISKFLEKIVVNAGIGRISQQANFEQKILPQILGDISAISGQKPEVTKAKKSIAGFKTREGQIIGVKITLRRHKMVDFFERLVTIVLPRFRDFRGLEAGIIDDAGALNVGFSEQFVFPEVNQEESPVAFSLGVNIVPKKKDREKALAEYRRLGVPLKLKSEARSAKS